MNFTFPNLTDRHFHDFPKEPWQSRPPAQGGTSVRQFIVRAAADGYGTVDENDTEYLAGAGVGVALFEGPFIWCIDDVSIMPIAADGIAQVSFGVFAPLDQVGADDNLVASTKFVDGSVGDLYKERSVCLGALAWVPGNSAHLEDSERCFHGPVVPRVFVTLGTATEVVAIVTVRAHIVGGHMNKAYIPMQPELRAMQEAGDFVMAGDDSEWREAAVSAMLGLLV